MKAFEVNFDGLVGPTHNYAGLSYGNMASMSHKAAASNPRQAALQGLIKAKALADLGLIQGILAPQERPDLQTLRALGFSGSDHEVIGKAAKHAPEILAACCSASSMWTANAATVSPSADSADRRVHFTAANLNEKLHRAIEHPTTTRILRAMFADDSAFVHHEALVSSALLGDEGAANHTRFCKEYGEPGVQFFVYGREALSSHSPVPQRFPARHTKEASEAVARLHRLPDENAFFAQQNPVAIDSGAFHNDVVSVGNQNVLFYHEQAFLDSDQVISGLRERVETVCGVEFKTVKVSASSVSLKDAVESYLFNSQLLTLSPGQMTLVAPEECQRVESVKNYLDSMLADSSCPIKDVKYFDLRQSMQNGGGPACLRLRVVLTQAELAKMNASVLLNDRAFALLKSWVEKHYRDRLSPKDLADPHLLIESRTALDELTQILSLGSVYPFQK